jgi:hypothetical protein
MTIIFGRDYQAAAPLLGWMGMAMIGVSLSSIWLNYYLAERPRNFVILLGIAVAFEWALLNLLPLSMQSAVVAFGLTGWLLSFAGLMLYILSIGRLPRRDAVHPRLGLMPVNELYHQHNHRMDDFWSRRANAEYEDDPCLGQLSFDSNYENVLEPRLQSRYSTGTRP